MSRSGPKGNSGNTNGGTETSFTKTPQAKDDIFGTLQAGQLDYADNVYLLDVMANDLGGNSKSLWSVDDGINDSGAMNGYEAGDLLTQDHAGITGLAENKSLFGAALSVTADGRVAYDASTISGQTAADLTGLALGDTMADSFIYAIRMTNGTLSWAKASVTLTGVNDTPEVTGVSLAAIEDNGAVTGNFDGDDVDSDDDPTTLIYTIVGEPDTGTLTNNNNGTFTFDPGAEFQSLAKNEEKTFELSYTATDSHNAVSEPASLTITVTGTNDDPSLAAGIGAATEDGPSVSVDLSVLGSDIDSDNDGSDLTYTITGSPAEGGADIDGTDLTFDPGDDFQDLNEGQTRQVNIQVTAEDRWEATATNNVTITVTGINDAPTIKDSALAAVENGAAVSVDLTQLGDDADNEDDGESLTYTLLNTAPGGSASIDINKVLTFNPGDDFQSLAKNQQQSFDLTVRATDARGAYADNTITVTVTGVNDDPTMAAGFDDAVEDGTVITVDLSALGDDVDSDDDGNSLTYTISGAPGTGEGSASISGTDLTFDPGSDFQDLAAGETRDVVIGVTATDDHGASASNEVTITITGTNDDPTMAAGIGAATEDGPSVTVDLSALGDDIDSNNDGSNLTYTITGAPSAGEGSASITGTDLTFDPGSDFQDLAVGETRDVVIGVTATDDHGATATNDVTITVTGTNDAPEFTGGNASATITMNPAQAPFTVEQWTGYNSNVLTNLQAYASNNAPNYTVTTNIIDYTDDPAGFSGEIPGSTPWPAAQATGASGTGGINDNFFARVTTDILITESDTYTFRTFNDDGVFLRVNNQLIISDTGYHPEAFFEGSIELTPGVYPLELYFYEGGGEASLELTYKNSSGIYQHVGNGPLSTTGTLTFDDVDLSDAHTVTTAAVGAGTAGTLTASITADTTGSGTGGQVSWSYELDGSDSEQFQSLAAGETAVQEFTVTVSDGKGGTDTQTVSVTIEGVNDLAVLGNAVANLTETDEQLTTSGTLSISDVDNGEAFFNTQTNTAGTYGSFSIDANGNWSFASDGALNELEEGEIVTDIFNVTSVDGTATTVTVNITGTADGPVAVDDSNSLTTSAVTARADNTVYWVDWQNITQIAGTGPRDDVQVTGTITLPDRIIEVTYTGQIYSQQTYISPTNTTNRWDSHNGSAWLPGGDGVYTSTEVLNGPGDTNFDFIALAYADTARNVSFSEPVENLFFAVASMNNNGYLFDQPFTVVSSADAANNRGEWGHTAGITLSSNNGQYGISTAGFSPNEFHGVLAINNAVQSLTWVSQAEEFWQGFTVGTYGIAQTATVSGNVLSNDDTGAVSSTIEVSAVDGTTMVGNSVTLNLASGAIIKVDKDGEYLYDDNGQFEHLAAGQTFTESVEYTVIDSQGNTDTATLSIVVNGINDAPVANDDTASVNEDASVSINVLANDTDPDNGDTLSLVSAANGQHGTASVSAGQVLYTPNAGYYGADSFTYTMQDAAGLTSTATVNVTVNKVNEAPTMSFSGLSIINPSFEQASSTAYLYGGNTHMTGWTVTGVDIDRLSSSVWQSGDGTYSLDLNGYKNGGIVQTLATTPGETYTIGFMFSKNPGVSTTANMRVTADGTSQDFAFSDANSTSDMKWTWKTFTFTATDSSTDLAFTSLNMPYSYPFGGGTFDRPHGPALDGIVPVAAQAGVATNIGGFSANDDDAGNNAVRINLSVDHGTLSFANLSGLTAIDGDGSDGTLAYTGSLAAVNAALNNGVVYTGTSGYSGMDTLTAQIDDLGSGTGTSLTDSASVDIRVVGAAPDYVFG